jgi:CO/xanthine dehydrogenase FAD-binding subunit
MPAFDYRAAKSVEELLILLSEVERRVKILAGGTDLLIQLREGKTEAGLLVDIKKIPQPTARVAHRRSSVVLPGLP